MKTHYKKSWIVVVIFLLIGIFIGLLSHSFYITQNEKTDIEIKNDEQDACFSRVTNADILCRSLGCDSANGLYAADIGKEWRINLYCINAKGEKCRAIQYYEYFEI